MRVEYGADVAVKPTPGLAIEQQPASWMHRACVWAEARGESPAGKLAVAWVIRNRAAKAGILDLREVVLAKLQFSSFNAADPNHGKLLRAHELDPRSWAVCDAIVELMEEGLTVDPTKGSTHYYAFALVDPPWGRRHPAWQELATIGAHVFGRTA